MRRTIILLLIFILFPCQSEAIGLQKTMRKIMSSWVGESYNTVVNHWGQPQRMKYSSENIDYYWILKTRTHVLANISGNTIYGGYYRTLYCVRILSVNKSGQITSWSWEGNYCPATEINRMYKDWDIIKLLQIAIIFIRTLFKRVFFYISLSTSFLYGLK